MAGLNNTDRLGTAKTEPAREVIVDIDEIDIDDETSDDVEASEQLLFAKSTDVRRRIEEKLEIKVLRDELGMDDFEL